MLDMKIVRQDPEKIRKMLQDRAVKFDLDLLLEFDKKRREMIINTDMLRKKKNEMSIKISEVKKTNGDATSHIQEMQLISQELSKLEKTQNETETEYSKLAHSLPNLLHESVPIGNDASGNTIVREFGDVPEFDFKPRDHTALGESLGLFDMIRGSKISGSGFPLYMDKGANLERKLINAMLEHHKKEFNYTEIFPPVMMLEESMRTTGQLPKFEDDMYHTESDHLYLAPTAEVPVTNIHRNEILNESDLPINYVAYSPCFRRESGSYGKDTRGLLRVHQFNKVELVKFTKPESSYDELESLTRQAESVLKTLELTYRVVELCTGDLSFAAAKCYDIEVWAPGERKWLEVSSCSNFEDFQARRGKIRYRNSLDKKVEFVHTLNGSGLATPRLMIALLETYQNKVGQINFPDSVADFLGIMEIS